MVSFLCKCLCALCPPQWDISMSEVKHMLYVSKSCEVQHVSIVHLLLVLPEETLWELSLNRGYCCPASPTCNPWVEGKRRQRGENKGELWKEVFFQRGLSFCCSSAYDTKTRQKVAVKKLSRPFQSLIHARRTYRELRLLKHMKHENVSEEWVLSLQIFYDMSLSYRCNF